MLVLLVLILRDTVLSGGENRKLLILETLKNTLRVFNKMCLYRRR